MSHALHRYEWRDIQWKKIQKAVYKLQKRIYKASERGDGLAVKKLQKLMLKSKAAKLLAVRKVTQDNRGKRTAGIDGKNALTPQQRLEVSRQLSISSKAKPTRRVWIPKPGKTEKRPLGIPTIDDRALQALVKLALEPEWEAKFEPNSYGFRPGRSAHDAIEAIFASIKIPKYVLDADISQCFDKINHGVLLDKLGTFPAMRRLIKAWLKGGVIDNGVFQKTDAGTPQGGVISPLLANIALHGMENDIKNALLKSGEITKKGSNPVASLSIIRYADDFVVIYPKLEIVEKCQVLIQEWLNKIGLELKDSKTSLVHTFNEHENQPAGFDFLGFNVRQYKVGEHNSKRGYKTLIKPSNKAIKTHLRKLKSELRGMRGATQDAVIRKLSPIIRGWCNYYSTVVSSEIFDKLGDLLYKKLWRWAEFRHHNKGAQWIKRKYFRAHGKFIWMFKSEDGWFLQPHGMYKIKRHTKVKGIKSPFDGDRGYWSSRVGKHPLLPDKLSRLIKVQSGKCSHCGLSFIGNEIMELHHLDGNHKNNKPENLMLVHGHCHDHIHRTGMLVKHQEIEEPNESERFMFGSEDQ
jgi:RNA-directed DNA polymerase